MHNVIDMYHPTDYTQLLIDRTRRSSRRKSGGNGAANDGPSASASEHAHHLLSAGENENENENGGNDGNVSVSDSDNEETHWKEHRSWNPLQVGENWPHHCAANASFAHKLQCIVGASVGGGMGVGHGSDELTPIIWIHGYELMILPSYLVRRIPGATVGLFLDVPFPSSEIFRTVVCYDCDCDL